MSQYDWPRTSQKKKEEDNPAARLAFTRRRHREFDPEGALRARSGSPRLDTAIRPPGPFAPASGRVHLWQPLGPITLLGGQAEGNPRVSGRVNAICVHDLGLRAYAASANGGVWYTRDGGANWVSVAGLASTNTVGILQPAQRNACGALHVNFGATEGEDLVFLGTGELTGLSQVDLTGQPGSSEAGIGILVGDKPTLSNQPDPWQREAPNLVNNGVFRIVQEPGGNTVIAATRKGLFQRPASPATDKDWERLPFEPFNTLEADCTDLLWTPAVGTSPPRLWVWVMQGPNFGLWVRATGAGGDPKFNKVAVDPASGLSYAAFRASLAASTPASQVWVLNDHGRASTSPALFRVTNPAAGTAPVAHGVTGVPNILRDQGFYDIAIAVDPANSNRVALAGSFLGDPYDPADILLVTTPDGAQRYFDASIVFADVAPDPANGGVLAYGLPATPYTMIGIGVHPDVHALVYSNGGGTLWAGCDGGVFRSDRPTSPAGFYSRNNGMSISESNYFANHPTCEGHVIAGLQDNGTIVRSSTGVWNIQLKGDGGGVVMDAARPDRSLAQYVQGSWTRSVPGGGGPAITKAENEVSAFYSSAACIEHVRTAPPAPPARFSQTILGTNRLWYSDDFGTNWVTLPAGTNPLVPPVLPHQDKLAQPITVCRWQSPDVAWVLCEQLIMRYARTSGSHNPSGPGTWTSAAVMPPGFTPSGKAKKRPAAPPSLTDSKVWTDIAVNLEWPGPGLPPIQRGTLGAVYIGTVGHPDKPNVDTLWWFDGTDKWHPTGLRTDAVPAPVTAIVCDPLSPTEVWVGTTVGVWRGIRTDHGASPPTWAWQAKLNGLPEAAVEDLTLFRDGTLVILRAAIAARGLWELRLDAADVQELTYLRAHDDDLRHRNRAVETQRDPNAAKLRSWHGSPDVRPRIAPALVPAPASLKATPWQRSTFPGTATEQLRRFQAALRSSVRASTGQDDPRIIANGVWDGYFSEVLRDHGAPTVAVPAAPPIPALNAVQINEAFWNLHMQGAHATAEPWVTATPTEADLYELTAKLEEGTLDSTSCSLPARNLKVDIVVHHRGMDPMDGANVRVTLLWWKDPAAKNKAKWNDSTGANPPKLPWSPGVSDVPWTATVNEVLNNDAKPDPNLGAGWRFALGNVNQTHFKTLAGQTLDPMRSGIATFDLNLTGLKKNTVVLLVAVIRAGLPAAADNIALAPANLKELALTSPNVAVRSLKISS